MDGVKKLDSIPVTSASSKLEDAEIKTQKDVYRQTFISKIQIRFNIPKFKKKTS